MGTVTSSKLGKKRVEEAEKKQLWQGGEDLQNATLQQKKKSELDRRREGELGLPEAREGESK